MDAYDRCTNLGKEILPSVLRFMVKAEKFSDHPRQRCKSRKLHMYFVEFIDDVVQVYTVKDIHSSHCFVILQQRKI